MKVRIVINRDKYVFEVQSKRWYRGWEREKELWWPGDGFEITREKALLYAKSLLRPEIIDVTEP